MALKLGKCRLCLKLGDFYSIFTVDNNLQLAEMVMECARVKIYDGDGLPDKICSECIQKLSSAHIFKQQCERSDQELRRNYVPPPGFSSPTPPNRQSSDSAFSSQTEVSKPSSTFENKVTPVSRSRKRSGDSNDDASISSRSHDYRPGSSKRVDELRMSQKKPRLSMNSDSDYDDNSASFYSAETDSDEPLLHKCKQCGKAFRTHISLSAHMKCHKRKNALKNFSFESPKEIKDATDEEDKLSCDKCGKQFKLKIMLKRHHDICGKSPRKELMVALEPIDAVQQVAKIDCTMCTTKFKTIENLEKHMRVVHAAVLKRDTSMSNENGKICVPCLYCGQPFDDYYIHSAHFNICPQKNNLATFECPVCTKVITKKGCYFLHVKAHFFPLSSNKSLQEITSKQENFQCRMCNKKLPSQDSLITHLAAHMSNVDEADEGGDEESRASTIDDSASVHSEYSSSGPLKCKICDKSFKYKKSLLTHEEKHTHDGKIKIEMPDRNNSTDLLNETTKSMNHYESESSQDEGEEDNTCDICEKQFSYKRLLVQHKRTKHPMTSGFKRAKINLKNCSVRCLICDIEMKVSAINEHNQTHISVNIKPRNLYTCMECEEQFKSCSALANHIKIIHRLKQQPSKINAPPADLADFCEVVVTKAEPLDELQSHNGFGEVSANNGSPSVNMSGFTCPICNKQLPTLISLKRHVNWHNHVGKSMEKKLECFVCKETFRFQCHYKIHMREHYNDTNLDPKLLTCSICNRKSKHLRAAQAHMNYHKQTRFQNKDYECSICKRVFQHRKVYLSHMAIHYKRGESANNTIVGYVLPNSVDKNKFDGTHTCHHCGKVCDSENSLKHHIRWHNSKTSLFGARHECHICNLQFTNKRRLELHTRTHFEDDNGPYKCNICGKGYIDEDYYKRHVKGHNFDHQSHKKRIEKLRKNKVKCPICSRYYPDLVKLIRHLRRTHPESKMIKEDPDAPPPNYYSCKLCAKVFLDERRLQFHEEAHLRKPEFYKCKFCGKKTISLKNHRIHIKGHLTQKYIDNPLKCPHCTETFMRGYDLHYHLRDAHDINETWIEERRNQTLDGPLKELQCSICFKVLASKGNFERHIDYHNSLRCNYCFDYFSSLRFLEGHLAFSCDKKKLIGDTEIYPKKVKCHICYKAFHLQVKLDCHLRTQHEIKTFKKACEGKQEIVCDYCFKVFENEYALSTHKIYHRTVGYYGCIYCNRKFNTMTLYRKHKNHHFSQLNVDNPTKCEHCDETFVAFREMIYHMRDVHGDDKEWIVLPKESIEEKCNICQKTFFNLHRHLDYHEENRCKKCGEYFFSRADYDNHLCAIDSDEEVTETNTNGVRSVYEECSFCFKPVTRKNSKRLHDQIHRGSGSISCRFCSLKFKTMDAFNIHAFSHRSRKYKKKPIKCRKCGEQFVKYGPFIKHMKIVHKCSKKLHYRATVMPEKCVVCNGDFPNLHNHYRAHLQNQCQQCLKYFTSSKVFSLHDCDKEDSDPSKVFICDANLPALINSYVPKDEKDDEKYYGHDEEGEEEEEMVNQEQEIATQDEDSQNSIDIDEGNLHDMAHAPIISDVLSLFKKKEVKSKGNVENDGQSSVSGNIVVLTDDDSIGFEENVPVITIDD
ncbi:zinc finger protein 729-like [Vanessa cardui]|uniref:zinc finger protein 729-like n=1 Tax=Vanessa cardui TaxID=171605 RepID=UPI001F133495|nr:zinc finger protein 729-like [Vanessa cardui]XP_046970194.1 zinc finger protein 729-like [Vanessa cardui]